MYPHERSLVQRFAGQPFVLLGVNSDQDRQALQQTIQQEQLHWRSWFDGGIDGPIHRQWNVTARPAVFLIDHQGVLRHKYVLDAELDRALEALVAEAREAG